MALGVPLTVRVRSASADRVVTRDLRDLSFRSVAPGGFASARLSLHRPLDLYPDDLRHFADLFVYDSRTGRTVWEGRVEDLGRSAADGGIFEVAAVGPSTHTRDRTVPLIYVDKSLERWARSRYNSKSAQTAMDEVDGMDDVPCLECVAPEGATVTTSWTADWMYRSIRDAGQLLARIRCDWHDGSTSANFDQGIYTRTGTGASSGAVDTDTFSTTDGVIAAQSGDTNFASTDDIASLRMNRNTSTGTVVSDDRWCQFYNVSVRAKLLNADGTTITTGYTVNNIDPDQVVNDLLGRLLTKYDGPNALVESSGFDILQLAYPDGVTPAQVLEDLMVLDPAYYWAAWESDRVTGLHRFEWRAWPVTVRYEADVVDGFVSPGSASELYNAVTVRYRTYNGRSRTTTRTSTVQTLTDAGLTRTAQIDLGDELAGIENAQRAGDNFLAEHASPPNQGTLTIARPVPDRDWGRTVMPWEILPGHLIRVRGVTPNVDSLNATARDGSTVFRIVGVDFDASTAEASLELDSYPRNVAAALSLRSSRDGGGGRRRLRRR